MKLKSLTFPRIGGEITSKKFVALDLGTTKFCLAHISYSQNTGDSHIDVSHVPAEGMHRGMLTNKQKAITALQSLIDIHEKKYQQDIRDVVVGIAGSHLRGRKITVSKRISKSPTSQRDLDDLNEQVILKTNNSYREIMHIIPVAYQVDSRFLEKPIGSHGNVIACEYFVIDADRGYLKDVIDVCNRSGLIIKKFYSEPFASASAILCTQFKASGCTIVDIGGGTSDGIIFLNNQPTKVYTVNIAGKMMTNDLSIGLGISIGDAEIIKQSLNNGHASEFNVTDIFGRLKIISRSECLRILIPRIRELATLINKEIDHSRHLLTGGIILTGGASEVINITEIFEKICSLPTRRLQPVIHIEGCTIQNLESSYGGPMSTVLGLLNLELKSLEISTTANSLHWSNRFLGSFLNWIKELY